MNLAFLEVRQNRTTSTLFSSLSLRDSWAAGVEPHKTMPFLLGFNSLWPVGCFVQQ